MRTERVLLVSRNGGEVSVGTIMGAERPGLVSLHYGMAGIPWTEPWMRLPCGMYWLEDGIVECLLNRQVQQLEAVGRCPYVTCARIAEGCGLIADG